MIKVYNTLSQKKEILKPIKNKEIKMFVCGPTVYDFSHIGHARTYIIFDVICKYLRSRGYKVFYLQNITDIDDKIINRAKEEKTSWKAISERFEKEYFKDMKALKIDSVTKYARATEHIKEIISQVKRLREKGFGYETRDGIYYDISKFKDYGKLSKRTVLQAEDSVSRIDESVEKRNKGDFCLWKFSKPDEPKWKSPWGEGRPGWHIEDTAITEKYFGSQYDLHGGAMDLIFPHHEAEIAQMEAISGKVPMVKYWLHTGLLTIKRKKMSKSLKNFITIREFLEKYNFRLLRFFVIKHHYRSQIDFNDKKIFQAQKELEKLDEFIEKISNLRIKKLSPRLETKKYEKKFILAMDDDFNTPKAIGIIFELIRKANQQILKGNLSQQEAKKIFNFLKKVDKVFGFIFFERPKKEIPQDVIKLVKEREKYRKEGNFERADKIRETIKRMGYWIEDTKEGPKIKKLKLNHDF
jgi:cysteinyl-tRNA synthetase